MKEMNKTQRKQRKERQRNKTINSIAEMAKGDRMHKNVFKGISDSSIDEKKTFCNFFSACFSSAKSPGGNSGQSFSPDVNVTQLCFRVTGDGTK